MRPIQNAGGEEVVRERSYPVASTTAIAAGQVVQLSAGKVVPAIAAQTGAILGIAGENHPGTADMLNPRANGDEILVCDNPGLIFECPVPTLKAASGSATTIVPATGGLAFEHEHRCARSTPRRDGLHQERHGAHRGDRRHGRRRGRV